MTPGQYDALERAISRGERIALRRRGGELVLIPLAIGQRNGKEFLEARQPTTGEPMSIPIDDIDAVELVT